MILSCRCQHTAVLRNVLWRLGGRRMMWWSAGVTTQASVAAKCRQKKWPWPLRSGLTSAVQNSLLILRSYVLYYLPPTYPTVTCVSTNEETKERGDTESERERERERPRGVGLGAIAGHDSAPRTPQPASLGAVQARQPP
ncbi:hypothetical protein GQ53DRAFT_411642 [Thozetella sp. PMI_491]|nr:hypothetical protein GQ53DRAFT_411642 [Thozetella sp. PMI_491]